MGRGLAEQLGARDRLGRGFSLDERDIGIDVTGYIEKDNPKNENIERVPLPKGHRFFHDCERETSARMIEWLMTRKDVEAWFVTLTFKNYVSRGRAWGMAEKWLWSIADAWVSFTNVHKIDRSHGLNWVVAQEWQKRDVIHFHIILSGVRLGALSRKRWELRWSGMGGGFARIYDARLKAAPYLAKYTGKTYHNGSLSWGGTWRGYSPPGSLGCCKA